MRATKVRNIPKTERLIAQVTLYWRFAASEPVNVEWLHISSRTDEAAHRSRFSVLVAFFKLSQRFIFRNNRETNVSNFKNDSPGFGKLYSHNTVFGFITQ